MVRKFDEFRDVSGHFCFFQILRLFQHYKIYCWSAGKRNNAVTPYKTYCLPRLLYGCEIWPLSSVNIRDLNVIWNNCFRHVFNCCWRESVKPLQFYCNNLPLSHLLNERQLIFFRKLFNSNNRILRALIIITNCSLWNIGISQQIWHLHSVHYSIASIKTAIWSCFVSQVEFQCLFYVITACTVVQAVI